MPKRNLRITLKKSPVGRPKKHRVVLRGLGLRRINQTVVRPDEPETRGMIKKVIHMVEVLEEE
jgi:large subunit ribosomal protein L30